VHRLLPKKTYYINVMEELVPKEPFLIKSIVNGLIATSIIWTFWTPFLVFIASPLMNAMIKNFLCHESGWIPYIIYTEAGYKAFNVYNDNLPKPPTVAMNMIDQDKTSFIYENLPIYLLFALTSVFVIGGSLYSANYLITAYNLNRASIVNFNLMMVPIIFIIELIFFIGVAVGYYPFDTATILGKISQKVHNLINSLT